MSDDDEADADALPDDDDDALADGVVPMVFVLVGRAVGVGRGVWPVLYEPSMMTVCLPAPISPVCSCTVCTKSSK